MEDGWAKSPSEEMATLLMNASFAVNPDFSSSDGLGWQFSLEARVGIMQPRKGGKPAGLANRFDEVSGNLYVIIITLRIVV